MGESASADPRIVALNTAHSLFFVGERAMLSNENAQRCAAEGSGIVTKTRSVHSLQQKLGLRFSIRIPLQNFELIHNSHGWLLRGNNPLQL